ncbi:MAG: hypothetical protein HYZ28_08800 [Myxococcales bacterium]|nr:hypothetical protein [Myxococcales bacterium]
MKSIGTGAVLGLSLALSSWAAPPTRDALNDGDREGVERAGARSDGVGAFEQTNQTPPPSIPRLFVRDPSRERVIGGRVVEVRRKQVFLKTAEGPIVPLDTRELSFRRRIREGEEVRASFQVEEGTVNMATAIWKER